MGTLQVGGTTLGVKNTSTNKIDLSNVGDVTLTSSANIKGAINASGSAPIYACRAWVRFEDDGTTIGSGNVSSVTHSTTGRYVVNFTSNMPDTNYVAISGQPLSGYDDSCGCQFYQVGSVGFDSSSGSAYINREHNCVAIFR